uniref:C-X-C motif chemokine ligand 12 n=1 Tax=Saimiri boliviensis boliviensis TaxID=39432 RepID=A0A2K6U8K4_SAIBB
MNAKVLVVLALVLTALCLSDGKPVSLSYRCPCRFFESHYCTCLNRVSFHGAAPLTQGYWVLYSLSCTGGEAGPRLESHQEGCLGVPGPVSLGK